MRVFLTKSELNTELGKELLNICLQTTKDGRLVLDEIITLRRWLRTNRGNQEIAAIPFLDDIMRRITDDKVIDKAERRELTIAMEKVLPTEYRTPVKEVRKKREKAKREHQQQKRKLEREQVREKREKESETNRRLNSLLQHISTTVGGTNSDSEYNDRQYAIAKCKVGERLVLEHHDDDPKNVVFVVRQCGEELGFAWESETILKHMRDGWDTFGVVTKLLGGTAAMPFRNIVYNIFMIAPTVSKLDAKAFVEKKLKNYHVDLGTTVSNQPRPVRTTPGIRGNGDGSQQF